MKRGREELGEKKKKKKKKGNVPLFGSETSQSAAEQLAAPSYESSLLE